MKGDDQATVEELVRQGQDVTRSDDVGQASSIIIVIIIIIRVIRLCPKKAILAPPPPQMNRGPTDEAYLHPLSSNIGHTSPVNVTTFVGQ